MLRETVIERQRELDERGERKEEGHRMVAIWEYRIVLPFTMEEYEVAQLYMVAKYSASESAGDNGDGVEVLKNEPFVDGDRRGQYTHKIYHLASKLPSWLVSLLPKRALMLEEEAWNAYPHCTTILKCPFLHKFKLVLETTHVADRGTTENALKLDAKTLKKRQVEYIDIAMDQPENYLAEEDPTLFKSQRTGRGPLRDGWQQSCKPFMCAYKLVTVDVPYWGFGSRIEKFISKNAQRKILLEGHRKCFCWLDEWFGLKMEDVRRLEHEMADAIRLSRAEAMQQFQAHDDEVDLPFAFAGDASVGGDTDILRDKSQRDKSHPGTPLQRAKEANGSQKRRSGVSLVGPSFSVGINTLYASEVDQAGDISLGGYVPPIPSLPDCKSSENEQLCADENVDGLRHEGSCESFTPTYLNSSFEASYYNLEDESSSEVSTCVDVLDRVIAWTKNIRLRRSGKNGAWASGIVAPVDDKNAKEETEELDQYVEVLDSALSAVKKRPSKNRLCD